jgi:hypothetical protein
MRFCWLLSVGSWIFLDASLWAGHPLSDRHPGDGAPPAHEAAGFLKLPVQGCRPDLPAPLTPYFPQAGDIILYDDLNPLHHWAFRCLAGSGPPTHACIVIEQDCKPILLELTGPTVPHCKVCLKEVFPRLEAYTGAIMVRRLRQPLTPEQSAELTHFALAQQGKNIAFRRGLLQATPFRCRNGLRHWLFAHTYLNRRRWFCSELVVAAASAAHVLDPHVCRANATYPRDLAYDEIYDLSPYYEPPLPWVAHP